MAEITRGRLWGWLIRAHRYLGVGFCALFVLWFASGIVLVYRRMPSLGTAERLAALTPLATDRIRVPPAAAWRGVGRGWPSRVRIAMLLARPVYRFLDHGTWVAAYADDGSPVGAVDSVVALAVGGALAPRATVRYRDLAAEPDQWTLSTVLRRQGPLHRLTVDDGRGTSLYVTRSTGEAVMRTDRWSRWWGYSGAVVHWLFFTPLRMRTSLWSALVIYGSLVGGVLCLSGLVVGVYRLRIRRRYRGGRLSPHHGWLRWHHFAGLIFGLVTFTWVFSGMLSMSPWDWSPGSTPTDSDVRAVAGGDLDLSRVTIGLSEAARTLGGEGQLKELEIFPFMGRPYFRWIQPPAAEPPGQWANTDLPAYLDGAPTWRSLVLPADRGGERPRAGFGRGDLEMAARAAMPGHAVRESTWLNQFDRYYYPGHLGGLSLPVLRTTFEDGTWLYLDPRTGAPVLHHTARSRAERWLYHGLHSLDFPGLYQRRPLWDLVVVLGSLGGLLVSATAVAIGWRRVRGRRIVNR